MFLENAPSTHIEDKMDTSNIHFINTNTGGVLMAKYKTCVFITFFFILY